MRTKDKELEKELTAVKVLVERGYTVTLFKYIDQLHTVRRIYTPKDFQVRESAKVGK